MYRITKREKINLINLATGKSLFLSESGLDYILDGKPNWGAVEANINYVGYVNQIGSQKTNTQLNPRPITITGWIVATSIEDMETKKKFLNRFVNPFQDMRCEYKEYFIDFTPDKSVKYPIEYSKNNEVICNFEIEGTCGVPLFSNTLKTIVSQSPSYAVAVFPMIIYEKTGTILGRAGQGARRIVENTGSVDAWFSLTITCLEGTITNPKIMLGDNSNTFIKVNVTMQKDEKLFISTEYGQEAITLISSDGKKTDLMVKLTRDSDLFLLSQGENILIVSDDDDELENVDFTIRFSPLYMEVE